MAATPGDRRTPRRRPSQPRGSGPGAARRPARKRAERERVATVARVRAEERRQFRLTGRAAILVLVLAVLAVSYASSLRAYLQQRHKIDTLLTTVEEKQASIDRLAREADRHDDPAFIEQEARRYGFVEPGETPYVAIDGGEPLTGSDLDEQPAGDDEAARAWFDDVWSSVKVAGNPPTKIQPPPKQRIVGSEDE